MSKKTVALSASLSCLIIISAIAFYINGCRKDREPVERPENDNVEQQQTPDNTENTGTSQNTGTSKETTTTTVPISNVTQEKQGWIQDFEKAKKMAAEQNKDILMNFTGSDWCRWCIKLHDEVFGKQEFIEKASKNFILLELDSPRNESLVSAEIRKQNKQLQEKYGIEGYPTVLLTNDKGIPYARTGYRQGGVDAYLDHLEKQRNNGNGISQLISKAESSDLDGVQKAMLIDQALKRVSPELVKPFYSEYVDQIIALDSKNEAGLRKYYMVSKRMWKVEEDLNNGNISAALEKIDAAIEEFDLQGELAQEVYYFKAFVQHKSGNREGFLASLQKSYKTAPDSELGKNVRQTIIQNFPDTELD